MTSLGARVAQARKIRSKTQDELAEDACVSVDLVKKLERGAYGDPSLATLRRLAQALQVTPGYLIDGDPDTTTEDGDVKEPDRGLLLPARRLLLTAWRADEPADEAELAHAALRRRLTVATEDFNRGRYEKVVTETPGLICAVEASIGMHENEAKAALCRLSAHAYILTAQTLIHLRGEDLAYHAIKAAMEAADDAGDPVLKATAGENFVWAFNRQGMYDAAESVALAMAGEIEPSDMREPSARLAAWGRLQMEASTAAAHRGRLDTADDLLSLAHMAAVRVGDGSMDYGKYWSILNPTLIGMTKVQNAMRVGDAEKALHIAGGVGRVANMHLDRWAGHLLTTAQARTDTGDYSRAITTVKEVYRLAPEWAKNHRVANETVRRLLEAVSVPRARSSGLVDLARNMGVDP